MIININLILEYEILLANHTTIIKCYKYIYVLYK